MEHRYLKYNGDERQYAKLFEEYERRIDKFIKDHPELKNSMGGIGAATLAKMPFPPSKVEVIPDGYLLHVYSKYNVYPIDKITTKQDLLAWLRCISEKTWFDGELCEDFINAVADTNGWKLPFYYD